MVQLHESILIVHVLIDSNQLVFILCRYMAAIEAAKVLPWLLNKTVIASSGGAIRQLL